MAPGGGKGVKGKVGGSVGVSASHSISVKEESVLRLSACPGHK